MTIQQLCYYFCLATSFIICPSRPNQNFPPLKTHLSIGTFYINGYKNLSSDTNTTTTTSWRILASLSTNSSLYKRTGSSWRRLSRYTTSKSSRLSDHSSSVTGYISVTPTLKLLCIPIQQVCLIFAWSQLNILK